MKTPKIEFPDSFLFELGEGPRKGNSALKQQAAIRESLREFKTVLILSDTCRDPRFAYFSHQTEK